MNLPLDLTPSELLFLDEFPSFIVDMIKSIRSLRRDAKLSEAEQRILRVIEAGQEANSPASQAAAMVHRVDVYRELGRLGPALSFCQKAHHTFQCQPSRHQRHNEAVAAYALGLIHQLLGNDMEGLRWYRDADQLFAKAKEDWAINNRRDQRSICTRTQNWLETLTDYLTATRTRTDLNLTARIFVPVMLSGTNGGKFSIAELEIDKCVVGREVTVGARTFQVKALKGNRRISLALGVEHYALEIPEEACDLLDASDGDFALVTRGKEAKQEGPGVLRTDAGREFGEFERNKKGEIHFVRSDAMVIGGKDIDEAEQIGYITALLKPA